MTQRPKLWIKTVFVQRTVGHRVQETVLETQYTVLQYASIHEITKKFVISQVFSGWRIKYVQIITWHKAIAYTLKQKPSVQGLYLYFIIIVWQGQWNWKKKESDVCCNTNY